MKNTLFLSITALILNYSNAFGQNGFSVLGKFKDKKNENITEFAPTPFLDGKENEKIRMAFGSSFQIKNSKEVIFKLTRVRQKSSSEMGELEIDTDSPYPNNQLEKGMVDFYMLAINKPIVITFNDNGNKLPIKDGDKINFGKSHLKMLHPMTEFSAIFLTHSPLENKTWADTIVFDGETYVNKYTMQDEKTVLLEGGLFKKIETRVEKAEEMVIPANGANIEVKPMAKEMKYKGIIQYDKNSLLIKQIDGELSKIETLNFFGQTHEKQSQEFFRVKNIVK